MNPSVIYTPAQRQFAMRPTLLFVRFEQGRGRGGVPKTWVPFMPSGETPPAVETLVRTAVQSFRSQCADPYSHGRDLMPGEDAEYQLHNIDGGLIESADQIRWETTAEGAQRAELVLTWGSPAERLATSR